jgi:hypothetical protein
MHQVGRCAVAASALLALVVPIYSRVTAAPNSMASEPKVASIPAHDPPLDCALPSQEPACPPPPPPDEPPPPHHRHAPMVISPPLPPFG